MSKERRPTRRDYPLRCRLVGHRGWVYLTAPVPSEARFDLTLLVPLWTDAPPAFHTPPGRGGFGTIKAVEPNPHYRKRP
jgi:hypothetical protein